ncbi:hypothetical protein [Chitinolyticbacter albus]|uniref:hypothetical protein n=1 Tax=Chitinolyticbacter albus TaxID=2961951 RepID=UPI00210BE765|nr:hypothetical protein [Chitinolyticbacter albus]
MKITHKIASVLGVAALTLTLGASAAGDSYESTDTTRANTQGGGQHSKVTPAPGSRTASEPDSQGNTNTGRTTR